MAESKKVWGFLHFSSCNSQNHSGGCCSSTVPLTDLEIKTQPRLLHVWTVSFLCDRYEESFLALSCSNICIHLKPPEGQILLKVLIIPCIHQTVVSLACCRGRYSLQVSQLLWLTVTDWSYLTVYCEQSRRDQLRSSCRQNKVLINVFVCFCWTVCHIKEQMQGWRRARLFEWLHRAAAWCRSRCRAWTSTGPGTNVTLGKKASLGSSSVRPLHPGRVSGPSPAFQYSLRHTGERFEVSRQSDVHVFGLWEEPGVPREIPAEVTTKRRRFLPCRDSADHHRALTFVMWGHRGLMEVWCNVRIEIYINRLCIWTTGVRTQKDEHIKAPHSLSDDVNPTDQQLPIEDTFHHNLFTISLTLLSTFLSPQ